MFTELSTDFVDCGAGHSNSVLKLPDIATKTSGLGSKTSGVNIAAMGMVRDAAIRF
jgi:hypothetical protein